MLPPLLANIIRHCSAHRVECVGTPWVLLQVVGGCWMLFQLSKTLPTWLARRFSMLL